MQKSKGMRTSPTSASEDNFSVSDKENRDFSQNGTEICSTSILLAKLDFTK